MWPTTGFRQLSADTATPEWLQLVLKLAAPADETTPAGQLLAALADEARAKHERIRGRVRSDSCRPAGARACEHAGQRKRAHLVGPLRHAARGQQR